MNTFRAEKIPLDTFLLSLDENVEISKKITDPEHELTDLYHEILAINSEHTGGMDKIRELAKRTFVVNTACQKKVDQLQREIAKIEHNRDRIWSAFDRVLIPLWKVDESLLPLHNKLVLILETLKKLKNEGFTKLNAGSWRQKLSECQRQLHEIESNLGYDPQLEIPKGQAVLSSILSRCYKLAHELVCLEQPEVDESLEYEFSSLIEIRSQLKFMLDTMESGQTVDPKELHLQQTKLRDVETTMKDGQFKSGDGSVPQGQAILRDILEECYDMIHACVTLTEEKQDLTEYKDAMNLRDEFRMASSATYNSLMVPLKALMSTATKTNKLMLMYVGAMLGFTERVARDAKVSPTLVPIRDRLVELITVIKQVRNERNRIWVENLMTGENLELVPQMLKNQDADMQRVHKELLEMEQKEPWVDAKGNKLEGIEIIEALKESAWNLLNEFVQ